MNRYFSNSIAASAYLIGKSLTAPGTPGSTLTIGAGEIAHPMLFSLPYEHWTSDPLGMNQNSVYRVQSAGLFSNFADGLVLDSGTYPWINIALSAILCEAPTGAATLPAGATATYGTFGITGAGCAAGVQVGDIVGLYDWFGRVAGVPDNDNISFDGPVLWGSGAVAQSFTRWYRPTSYTETRRLYDVQVLNFLHPVDWTIRTNRFYSAEAPVNDWIIALYGTVLQPLGFQTMTINSGFIGEIATFTLMANVEYTEASA